MLKFDDASYHARRAQWTFVNFPRVLIFDRYLDHPDGSPTQWPPLFDLALGGAARLWSRSELGFERTAAWVSPVLGALAVLPVFAAGRVLGGTGVALLAAALLATLPMHVLYSDVGNCDHHAMVTLLGAGWLALLLHAARWPGARGAAAALALVRAALLLTWSGSMVYLVVAEGTLLGVGLLLARRDLLVGQALGAATAALLVAPVVAATGEPLGGQFSVVALSFTHVLALVCVALIAACAAALLARRPDASLGARLASAALPGALLAGAALAVPALRAGILPGIDFVGAADVWAPTNFEQQPLFAAHRAATGLPGASALYGGFAFTLPLALAAVCERLRVPALRAPALLLAGWTAAFGVLAVTQIRFGNEFAPAAALATALLLAAGWRAAGRLGAGRRSRAARAPLAALVLLALWPGFRAVLLPRLERDLARLRGPARAGDPALATPTGTLYRFAKQVRAATPETSGFLDPELAPEYGILAPATFGHALHWPGRRAVPADPFGPYLDAAHFATAESFWRARDEDAAIAILARLDCRYVMTTGAMARPGPTIAQRLHARDGSAFAAHENLGRFRLVLAGPAGGRGFPGWPASRQPPYKLFERVPGALLEVAAPPGARVTAELELTTAAGYAFAFQAAAEADGSGRAELRLPYASEPGAALLPAGPWRVRSPARELQVAISEADVQRGARVVAGD